MNVERRVMTCRLLEKMRNRETYSKKLGLENFSTFQGMPITDKTDAVQRIVVTGNCITWEKVSIAHMWMSKLR